MTYNVYAPKDEECDYDALNDLAENVDEFEDEGQNDGSPYESDEL